MSQTLPPAPPGVVLYPDSDGKPMADNTKQARWIIVLFGNIAALFRDMANVFVAADLFWYPVRAQPGEEAKGAAPDVLVRSHRERSSR